MQQQQQQQQQRYSSDSDYVQAPPQLQAELVSARVVEAGAGASDAWLVPRVSVTFRVHGTGPGSQVDYVAAAPPERRASAAGSCLPFASEEQAMQNTPNRGSATAGVDGAFTATLLLPNSYYYVGTMLVPPSLHVFVQGQGQLRRAVLPLPQNLVVPFRALTYDGGKHPQTETDRRARVPADASQQTILYANAYPARKPAGGW
jgi:hypothetical protein